MVEMKDSGTIWLGQIPNSWKISKISALYELRTTKVSDKDYAPLSVTMKGILPQLETAAKTNAHDDRKLVKKGDFAINSRSDRRGSCGISAYDGSVSLINTVMKPRDAMNPDYYNWLFHTAQFADEFYKWGHGIVDDLWTTNWQDMKHIDIPVPSLEEQEKIAKFLDDKCSEIDALHSDIEKQIETLEEYKKSVITEAVTKGLNPDVEMKDSGIPYHCDGKIKFNACKSFKFVLDVMQAVAYKHHPIYLYNLLYSDYFALTRKELLDINFNTSFLNVDIDPNEFCQYAEEHGWFSESTGTDGIDMNKMLNEFGIPNEMSQGKSFDDLLNCLNNDGRVIVAVDADEYWYDEGFWGDLFDPNGANHAIEVIGFDPETNCVIVNDSGNPDGCGSEIPLDTFLDAWEDSGNMMIECYDPYTLNSIPA